jgi:putative transposase
MVWSVAAQVFSTLLELILIARLSEDDKKYTKAFDMVFRSEGLKVIRTPYRAQNANAYVERWVRTVREECLNKMLIVSQAHLRRVMAEFVTYHNTARPHQGLGQQIPLPRQSPPGSEPVHCHDVLGGIIHDYYCKAA